MFKGDEWPRSWAEGRDRGVGREERYSLTTHPLFYLGNLLGSTFPAVALATFGDDASAAFKHYKIAAERLLGRYALSYRIQKGFVTVENSHSMGSERQIPFRHSGLLKRRKE